jgi:hypothetical protein
LLRQGKVEGRRKRFDEVDLLRGSVYKPFIVARTIALATESKHKRWRAAS